MNAARRLFLLPVRAYRLVLSPLIGPCCRFQPSCSAYAMDAVARHGVVRGSVLACTRLLRCHPLSRRRGFDPVPEAFAWGRAIGYKREALPEPERKEC